MNYWLYLFHFLNDNDHFFLSSNFLRNSRKYELGSLRMTPTEGMPPIGPDPTSGQLALNLQPNPIFCMPVMIDDTVHDRANTGSFCTVLIIWMFVAEQWKIFCCWDQGKNIKNWMIIKNVPFQLNSNKINWCLHFYWRR